MLTRDDLRLIRGIIREELKHFGEKIMPAINDIETALATVDTDLQTLTTTQEAVVTALQGLEAGTIPQDVLDKVNAVDAGLKAINSALTAAEPATPPAG
jgi:hypothetical protein